MNNYLYRPTQQGLSTINQPTMAMPVQTYPGPFQQPVAPSNNIKWVQGRAGANAFPVNAGETAQLMDTEDSVFYIKSADYSGMPLPLRVFDYSERIQTEDRDPQVARSEFDELCQRCDALKKQNEELKKQFDDLMGGN